MTCCTQVWPTVRCSHGIHMGQVYMAPLVSNLCLCKAPMLLWTFCVLKQRLKGTLLTLFTQNSGVASLLLTFCRLHYLYSPSWCINCLSCSLPVVFSATVNQLKSKRSCFCLHWHLQARYINDRAVCVFRCDNYGWCENENGDEVGWHRSLLEFKYLMRLKSSYIMMQLLTYEKHYV